MFTFYHNYQKDYRSLLLLALPIMAGQLGNIITGLADTIMVGQHSTAELASSAFVNNIINTFIITGTGFSLNLTPLIGHDLARRHQWSIGGWLKNSIVANITTALILMGILLLIYGNVHRLGQPEELLPLIRPYFLVCLVSLLFVMMGNAFRQFVEGINDPTISMIVLLTSNIVNIIGNYILIYGKLGLPEMGLLGAGISTLFSRLLMLVLFVIVFLCKRSYAPYRKGFALFRVDARRWRRLNALGWPIGMQQGVESATFSITAIMVGWLGSLYLAAHQVAISISTISFSIFLGLGAAVAIRTSYFKGTDDWPQTRKTTVAGIHLSLLISTLYCLLLLVFHRQISFIFTDNVAVAAIVGTLLPILMVYQFVDGTQLVLSNALRGLSDVRATMWISLIANFLIAIPFGYLLGFPLQLGIPGIWMAYPASFVFASLLYGLRARKLMNRS